jgi:hypothetical protein
VTAAFRGFYCWFNSKLNIEFWTARLTADFGHVLLLVLILFTAGFGALFTASTSLLQNWIRY